MSLTYSKVPDNVRRSVIDAYNGYCLGCTSKATSLHHRKSNSKANNKRWSLFINSPFNLIPLCDKCHGSETIYKYSISDKVADMYEEYLQEKLAKT